MLKDIPRPQNIQCDAERSIKPDLICLPADHLVKGPVISSHQDFSLPIIHKRGFKRTDSAELIDNRAKQDFAKCWEKWTSILVFLHWSFKTKHLICDTRAISSKGGAASLS
jgi:hypothetical protein